MLLPNEWIENSIETYIYQHTTKSQIIYWIVLFAVTVTLVALPFIYVDISVQGSGVVRPVAEKAEITSSITEIVDSVFVKEGEQVNKGDVILRFRTNSSDYKINYQTSRLNDCSAQLADLAYLAEGDCPNSFSSPVRQQEYAYFIRKNRNWKQGWHKLKRNILEIKLCLKRKLSLKRNTTTTISSIKANKMNWHLWYKVRSVHGRQTRIHTGIHTMK